MPQPHVVMIFEVSEILFKDFSYASFFLLPSWINFSAHYDNQMCQNAQNERLLRQC